jgi:hypothetical protein
MSTLSRVWPRGGHALCAFHAQESYGDIEDWIRRRPVGAQAGRSGKAACFSKAAINVGDVPLALVGLVGLYV